MKNTPPKKRFKITNTMYRMFWCMLAMSAAIGVAVHAERHKSYADEKKALAMQIEQQAATNDALKKELEYYGTDAYVERIAGEKLGLVKPDETVFYVSDTP